MGTSNFLHLPPWLRFRFPFCLLHPGRSWGTRASSICSPLCSDSGSPPSLFISGYPQPLPPCSPRLGFQSPLACSRPLLHVPPRSDSGSPHFHLSLSIPIFLHRVPLGLDSRSPLASSSIQVPPWAPETSPPVPPLLKFRVPIPGSPILARARSLARAHQV